MQKTTQILGLVVIASLMASLSYAQGGYDCGECHDVGTPIRDCVTSGCHDTYDKGNHHTKDLAIAGEWMKLAVYVAAYGNGKYWALGGMVGILVG